MPKKIMPKIGLSLGSGGARGYCHIGVLKALVQNNIPIDYIVGCSMGAMVGGAYACGATIDQIEKAALTIKRNHIIDFDVLLNKRMGLMRGTRALKVVQKLIPETQQIEEAKIRFIAIASDIVAAKTEVIKKGPMLQAIRASIAVPFIFQPVIIGGKVLVDGGITNRVPIQEAYDFGADIVVAVDPFGKCEPLKEPPTSILTLAERCFTIMDWTHAKYKMSDSDLYICPDMEGISAFNFDQATACIDAGFEAMTKALPALQECIQKYRPGKIVKGKGN